MPSYRVTLLPSKHSFNATQKQNLLAAGLSSGLNLRYGCENGSCGKCLSRLVSGKVHSIRYSDYCLTDVQKANAYFLSCCNAAQSDCSIEAYELGGPNEIPHQRIRSRVYKLQRLAEDVILVALKTPRTEPLSFFAGQSVSIQLPNQLKSNKAIASCPCDGLKPEVHIKRHAGDAFSEYVFRDLKKNDSILIEGPTGNFVLDEESSSPFIFIALNSGFSSIKSLMEQTISLEKEQPVSIYWIVTPDSSHYMDNYCRSIEDALDNFSYYPLATPDSSMESVSMVLKDILQKEKMVKQAELFISLPESYQHMVKSQLAAAGLDEERWCIDSLGGL
jgi:CDP-4-dehydro-6-deoxyglucose reductase